MSAFAFASAAAAAAFAEASASLLSLLACARSALAVATRSSTVAALNNLAPTKLFLMNTFSASSLTTGS